MATIRRTFNRLWQPIITSDHNKEHLNSSECSDSRRNDQIENLRNAEYQSLLDTTYLDHAGTTPPAKSAVESWANELTHNLLGNPHSFSASSQRTTSRVEHVRLKALNFFNANPDDFDIVFVANATAAIKLVAEAFRDNDQGFSYGYHVESHTSLVGVRELVEGGSRCFHTDTEVEDWLQRSDAASSVELLAYPGQSNMTGLQLPLTWCARARQATRHSGRTIYTLLDAASLAATSVIDLTDSLTAPDFVAVSFYKIFGCPDLGALIVRKESADVLKAKRYFAGGTVDSVIVSDEQWHAKRSTIHASLEEGTLPFHNIIALDHAMTVHTRLFYSMQDIARHTRWLSFHARNFLQHLRHANGTQVCELYGTSDGSNQGPIIAFNFRDSSGNIISAAEVEKLCVVRNIQLRTGGLCNPGGVASHLELSADQLKKNYEAGHRCGGENDVIDGKPTGAIRISFGAMSTQSDLDRFREFIAEFFIDHSIPLSKQLSSVNTDHEHPRWAIDSLFVFPIKSCGGYRIPDDQKWQITPRGLAWDREWCLVHEGTNVALSQKSCPSMALLRPDLDLINRKLTISVCTRDDLGSIFIDLDDFPPAVQSAPVKACFSKDLFKSATSTVCGEAVSMHVYTASRIREFLSEALDTHCTLARYSRKGTKRIANIRSPINRSAATTPQQGPPIKLANESPILVVNRSSVEELNQSIATNTNQTGGRHKPSVSADAFRANIIVAPDTASRKGLAYIEDEWSSLSVVSSVESCPDLVDTDTDTDPDTDVDALSASCSSSGSTTSRSTMKINLLGPCQRCQMVSVNQSTGKRQQEPFSTLAKTRRKGDGRVWFGVHAVMEGHDDGWIAVGDIIQPE